MTDAPSNIPIGHYGVHTDEDGIGYLHQGQRNSPNFLGLQKYSPFSQKPAHNRACPHTMNVSAPMPDRIHWSFFCRILDDHLVQEMLPIPKERFASVPYLNDPNNELMLVLAVLAKLSSPIYTVVHRIDSLTEKKILDMLSLTNLTPLVLTSVRTSDQMFINKLVKEAQTLPRRLILTGESGIIVRQPMVRITTHMWDIQTEALITLPMEQLGVAVLRRHLRSEKLNTPFERKE